MIDPGRAFGTGAHPTTRLTLELLQELEPPAACSTSAAAPACSRSRPRSSASRRSSPSTSTPTRSRSRGENALANGVEIDARVCDALADELPRRDARGRERRARRRRGAARRGSPASRAITSGLSRARRAAASRAGGRSSAARTAAGPPTSSSAPEPFIVSPWRRSRFASSAARSRTSTPTSCANGCSPTGTSSATAPPTSRSSTPAASPTRPSRSRERKPRGRRARTRRVYVTGCGANLAADAFAGLPENVVVVARRSEETPAFVAGDVGAIGCVQAEARFDRVRAFVKVQDGCSFSCSFCVIPHVRGASRSRSADAVLREIRRRVAQGHREVVLTGINLGCYRDRAAGYDLPRLVREAGATPGLERLRLSSIEINHVDDALIAALRETPTVSRHLHVPLQSGDDERAARDGPPLHAWRPTSAGSRRSRSEFNLTSDVIVGFPAEDERAFANTLRTARDAGLTKIHVFPYSPRPGTVTAHDDPCPGAREEGARRAAPRRLARRLSRALADEARQPTTSVLVDRPGRGYGDDYSPWLVPGAQVGDLVRVRAAAVSRGGDPRRCLSRLPLLHALPRRRPRRGRRRLRRDPRHQPAGRRPPARHPRAARRELPRDRPSSRPTRRSACSSSLRLSQRARA